MVKIDLTGKRFGNLVVLYDTGIRSKHGEIYWMCKCDCGNLTRVQGKHLRSGNIKSCGCKRFEACKTHGQTNTRLYNIWCTMKARCIRKTSQKYNRYGGRGIKICDEWKNFEPFYNWSMSHGYNENLSIDRIDNNGNYEPSNCRWATAVQQANNTSENRIIEYKGEKMTISEASRKYNVSYKLLYKRIKRGWDINRAIETPKITTFLKGCSGK